MLLRLFTQRILFSILLVFCLIAALASLRSFPLKASEFAPLDPQIPPHDSSSGHLKPHSRCDGLSNSTDILVVVKTGANEVYDKLPTQLLTALHCYEETLIFSDLEQQIGPYHVYDALDDVRDTAKLHDPIFDYYRTLQEYQKYGQDISLLRETSGRAAWNLDKYKFLHMLEKSWKMKPGRKWYVFIEADTYLVRSNLLSWLERLDPSHLLYLGSPTSVNGDSFSHGGSGVILSGAAMSKFAEGDEGVAARYDDAMKNEQFGDYVLTKALRDKGVEFSKRWPMLQAEKPATIPFGPGPDTGTRHWCQPIVTMHHITPDEASRIWQFEQQRPDVTKPLLLHELYQHFIHPYLDAGLEDWYNLSDDVMYRPPGVEGSRQKSREDMSPSEQDAHMSFEHCGRACEDHPRCFQYVYSAQTCGFSFSYRLGSRRVPESGTSYKSGWSMAKIAQDRAANICEAPQWL